METELVSRSNGMALAMQTEMKDLLAAKEPISTAKCKLFEAQIKTLGEFQRNLKLSGKVADAKALAGKIVSLGMDLAALKATVNVVNLVDERSLTIHTE